MWEESDERKRGKYKECIDLTSNSSKSIAYEEDKALQAEITESMSPYEQENYLQIVIDVKRTKPCDSFGEQIVKNMLTRTLYIWAFKHPASGYVQGINDLAATLLYVFLSEEAYENDQELTSNYVNSLSEETVLKLESETYWCLEKFSENI